MLVKQVKRYDDTIHSALDGIRICKGAVRKNPQNLKRLPSQRSQKMRFSRRCPKRTIVSIRGVTHHVHRWMWFPGFTAHARNTPPYPIHPGKLQIHCDLLRATRAFDKFSGKFQRSRRCLRRTSLSVSRRASDRHRMAETTHVGSGSEASRARSERRADTGGFFKCIGISPATTNSPSKTSFLLSLY